MARVLITGASGYIGTYAVPAFLNAGHQVTAVSSKVSKHPSTVPGLRWIVADLLKGFPFDELERCDCVLHLAAPRAPLANDLNSHAHFRLSVDICFEILEYLRDHTEKHFLYASTGDVAIRSDRNSVESDLPQSLQSFYAASRAAAGLLIDAHPSAKQTCALRIFHPFGPGGPQYLVNRIFYAIREGRSVMLEGQKGVTISPIWVEELAKSLVRACELKVTGTLHLCGPDVLTIKDLADTAGRVLGKTPTLQIKEANPKSYKGSEALLSKSMLGFSPQVSVAMGYQRMFEALARQSVETAL